MLQTDAAVKREKAKSRYSSVDSLIAAHDHAITRFMRQDDRIALLPTEFRNALRYCLSMRGKRIRPTVLVLACEAAGGMNGRAAERAAAAVELVHQASLLYDDIIDKDEFRRGKETVHVRFGEDVAIVLAGILVMRALQIVEPHSDHAALLTAAVYELGCGEAMELRAGIGDVATYLIMIEKKTASLFAAAALIGATIGGADDAVRHAMYSFGKKLGMAFQLRDDVLGATGDEKVLGKPVGSDFSNSRPSIVSLHLLRYLDLTRDGLRALVAREGITALQRRAEFRLAVTDSQRIAVQHSKEALLALRALPRSSSRTHLESLARIAISRHA